MVLVAVVSLDPSGSITTASPYVQNCSSVNTGATGIQIDGNLHSAGNKSILANDFTQINSDGIGVHALQVVVVRWFQSLHTIVINHSMLNQVVLLEV